MSIRVCDKCGNSLNENFITFNNICYCRKCYYTCPLCNEHKSCSPRNIISVYNIDGIKESVITCFECGVVWNKSVFIEEIRIALSEGILIQGKDI